MTIDLTAFGWQTRNNSYGLPDALSNIRSFNLKGFGDGLCQQPNYIAFSPDGSRLVMSDGGLHRIQVFNVVNGVIVPAITYGSYSLTPAVDSFNTPSGVVFTPDGSRILVVDKNHSSVNIYSISGNTITQQSTYGSLGTGDGQFTSPSGIAITPSGAVVMVSDGSSRIQVFALAGNTLTYLYSYNVSGTAPGALNTVNYMAVHPDGQRLLVSDSGNKRIQLFQLYSNAMTYLSTFGSSGVNSIPGTFAAMGGAAITPDGSRIIAIDGGAHNRIQIITLVGNTMDFLLSVGSPGSTVTGPAHGQFMGTKDVAVSPDGMRIVVADAGTGYYRLVTL